MTGVAFNVMCHSSRPNSHWQSLMILRYSSQRDVNPKVIVQITFEITFCLQVEVKGVFRDQLELNLLFGKVKVVFSYILMDLSSNLCVWGSYLTKKTCVSVYDESCEGKRGLKTNWKDEQWKIKVKINLYPYKNRLFFSPVYVVNCKPAISYSWASV